MKKEMKISLQRTFAHAEENDLLVASTLDPRFKEKFLEDQ